MGVFDRVISTVRGFREVTSLWGDLLSGTSRSPRETFLSSPVVNDVGESLVKVIKVTLNSSVCIGGWDGNHLRSPIRSTSPV